MTNWGPSLRRSAIYILVALSTAGPIAFSQEPNQPAQPTASPNVASPPNPNPTTLDFWDHPFTLRHLWNWLFEHGPRIAVILLVTLIGLWLASSVGRRLVRFTVRHGGRAAGDENEHRAATIEGVFYNAARTTVIGVGLATLLSEIGVPVGPVLGGAAVFGLAIAFGAQSLIKDYFTGLVMLIEQQYLLFDVVKFNGNISGQVERITLRMTMLRDSEGQVHFVPHGQVNTVTNMSYEWARAVVNVTVAADEDVDRAMAELKKIAEEICQEPEWAAMILEPPTIEGVEDLNDMGALIRAQIKTRPMKHWGLRRELLRRVKNRFDALGIARAIPQRAVYLSDKSKESGA